MIGIGKFIDLTGEKFGRLTVLKMGEKRGKRIYWLCQCECGVQKEFLGENLKSGRTKSCGCYQLEHEDLTGKRYGRLTVIKYSEKRKRKSTTGFKHYWFCKCDCGNETVVASDSLKGGTIQSCGCMRIDGITKHDMRYTRLYNIWHGMKNRCFCENGTNYSKYGGRGITVCDDWLEFELFCDWALKNGYSDELTIDRIDVNGNYEPSNCRWATMKEQGNNRRNNKRVTYHGVSYTISELSDKTNIPYSKLSKIVKYDSDIETIIDETAAKYYVHMSEDSIADAMAEL